MRQALPHLVTRSRLLLPLWMFWALCAEPACSQDFQLGHPHVENQLIVGWKAAAPPPPLVRPTDGTVSPLPSPPALRSDAFLIVQGLDFVPRKVLLDGRAWLIESRLNLTLSGLADKARALQAHSGLVDYVVANNLVFPAQASAQPVDDPLYPQQKNLTQIDAPGAWKIHGGTRDVVVAVIDVGVAVEHPDLEKSLWMNPCEDANGDGLTSSTHDGNGVDDKCASDANGNGMPDDFHGWNVAGNNHILKGTSPHGTSVAGVIAAVRDNDEGIAGITTTSLAVVKTSESAAASVANVVAGLDYARNNGFHVANISSVTNSNPTLEAAVALAGEADMIVVAAAGDDGWDLDASSSNRYPASYSETYDHVITVAATQDSGALKAGSNHGTKVVELGAPGVGILSTFQGGSNYQPKDGSSMAAPHVSGVVALLLAVHPQATLEDIRACLKQGDAIEALATKTEWGVRLNARKAVEECKARADALENSLGPPIRPVLITD